MFEAGVSNWGYGMLWLLANREPKNMSSGARRRLYPEIGTYNTFQLLVSPLHRIYVEESGNPTGIPVVFVHGGPGGGTSKKYRRFFDPARYRIILFDQRGCGKSTPGACIDENTTWDLVQDMERIRMQLEIERWLLFGGSWGSTLSLAYAEAHPERVLGMILRGIFMLRERELKWFYQQGANEIFPDAWEKFVAPIPDAERGDMFGAYYRRLTSEIGEERLRAARSWTIWEKSTSYLLPRPKEIAKAASDEAYLLAFARVECHYFVNGGFFTHEEQLLDGIDRIRHIPAVIVQGRYDMVCPMRTAWELHRAWPEAEFRLIPDAGHSALETKITAELVAATEGWKTFG